MAAPTYQSFNSLFASATDGGTIAPAWPAHLAGDIALLFVHTANEAVTFLNAAGFAQIPGSPQGVGGAGGTGSTALSVYWCRATSAAMPTPIIAVPPLEQIAAAMVTVRGCIATGNPWNVVGFNTGTTSTAVSIPGATTTLADCLVVLGVGFVPLATGGNISGWTNADLTSLTERVDDGSLLGKGSGIGIATGIKAAAGAYANTSATLTATSAQARFSIALKPAVAAGPAHLYTFLTLQDPEAPDSEITLNVDAFTEEGTTWAGSKDRAFARNILDSRHTPKRSFRATAQILSPTLLDAFKTFISLGRDAAGRLMAPRSLYLRSDQSGALGLDSFVEVLVEIESAVPDKITPGEWTVDLSMEEV